MTKSPAAVRDAKKNWVLINISMANDGEGRRVLVGGLDEGDMWIERGKDVLVPPGVVERLENAVIGVPETDPENAEKTVIVDRQRFSFSIKGRQVD